MATLIHHAGASTLRRILPSVLLAASAMMVSSVVDELPTAGAAWDMDEFYACWDPEHDAYNAGDITGAELRDATLVCCLRSEGQFGPDGVCRAPTAITASTPVAPPSEAANPDVPSGPPPVSPTKTPKTTFTLAPIAPVP